MSYYIWLFINALVIGLSAVYIWVLNPNPSFSILMGQLFAQIAIVLFIININIYFIFLVIRKANRKIQIQLTKFARKMMKSHIPIAMISTSLIILHAIIMFTQLSEIIGYVSFKMLSGYLALAWLTLTLSAGYLRHKKASGFRRRFHRYMAFIFGGLFLLHLFLPM